MSFKEMDVRAGEVVQVIVIEPLLSKPQYHQKKKKKGNGCGTVYFMHLFFSLYISSAMYRR
jgi:hypothetical protein